MAEAYIADTQRILGAVITKPKLTDKYLVKPPVRFIHDIVKAVVSETGYLTGVYNEEELNSDYIADKDGKLNFLTKLISSVEQTLGTKLPTKASKIAAGLEPENTNLLLQKLADAASKPSGKKGDSKPAAKKSESSKKESSSSKESSKSSESPAPSKRSSKEESSSSKRGSDSPGKSREPRKGDSPEKARKGSDSPEKRRKDDEGRESKRSSKSEDPKKKESDTKEREDREKEREREKEQEREKEKEQREREREKEKEREREQREKEKEREREKEKEREREKEKAERERKEKEAAAKKAAEAAAKEEEPADENTESEVRRPSMRPQTARRAPPKQQTNVRTVEKTAKSEKIEAAMPAPLVIAEGGAKDDTDELIVKIEAKADDETPLIHDENEKHGILVQNILNTNKELQRDTRENGKPKVKDTKEIAKEKLQKELEGLRESIQSLTRGANPLGKCVDFVPEDIESMDKELEMWKAENIKQTQLAEEEERTTEQSLQPYYTKLNDLDVLIREQLAKINSTKAKLIENDRVIHQMLYMVVKS